MIKPLALFALLHLSNHAFAGPELTTCYTDVAILGQIEPDEDPEEAAKRLDQTVQKIETLFAIHGRINRLETNNGVSLRFMVSVTSTDADRVRELTAVEFLRAVIAKAGPTGLKTAAKFLGCKTDILQ